MSNIDWLIVGIFFGLLLMIIGYYIFKNKKWSDFKCNIFGKKATNNSYQNWDGRLDDMPELII